MNRSADALQPAPAAAEPLRRTAAIRAYLLQNLRAHAVARMGQALVGMLLVPYVLSHLTREEYGLWAWLLALSAYVSLSDFGLSQGNIRPLARAIADEDERRVGEIVTSALALHAAIAIVLLAVATVLSPRVAALFPARPNQEVAGTFLLLLAGEAVTVCGFPAGSMLAALQRLDLLHKVRIAQLVLHAIFTVTLLASGGRIVSLACLHLALSLFGTATRAWLCLRLHPGLRPALAPARDWPPLLAVGAPLVVLSAAGAIAMGFERVALGFFASLASIAQYAVAVRLVLLTREIPSVLVASVIPASAALDVAGEEQALRRLYLRGLKAVAGTVMPLLAVVWALGGSLIGVWLGDGFQDAAAVARPVSLGLLLPMLTTPGVHISIGRGGLVDLTRGYAIWAVAFVAINWAWLSRTGFAGAGWGMAAVDFGGTLWLLRRFHPPQTAVAAEGWSILTRSATGAAIAAGAALLSSGLLSFVVHSGGRAGHLIVLAVSGSILFLTYAAWMWRSGFLDAAERRLCLEAIFPRRSG